MAVATMRVPTIFTAVDRFSDVVSKMTNKTAHFSKSTVGAINRVDHRLNNMWGSMNNMSQLAIGGGIGGLFYYAGKDVMDYETKLASLAAVTGTKIGGMNKQIESLGKETERSVIDIAGAFEIVGSKMSQYLQNPEALKQITKESILLANASRMELEPAIASLTGVLNIYGLAAKKSNYIVNKLSAGEVVGSIKITETLDLLRQFGGTARIANVQVDESIALIQALTKSLGIEGVGRGIRNLMVDLNMVGAFDKNKTKALEKAGVNMDVLGDKTLSLVERLTELKKLEGNSAAMGLFFKKTGIQTGATLFQNFDDLKKFLALIQQTNPAMEQASKNTSTFKYMVDRLKDSFTNYIVTNNDANGALSTTKSLIRWMTDNMGTIISLIEKVLYAFIAWKAIVGINLLVTKSILGVKWAILMATKAMRLYNIASLASAVSGETFMASLLGVSGMSASFALMATGIGAAIALIGVSMYVGNQTTKKFAEQNNLHLKKVESNYDVTINSIMSKMDKAIAKINELKRAEASLAGPLVNEKQVKINAYEKKLMYDQNVAKPSMALNVPTPQVNKDRIVSYNEAPKNLAGEIAKFGVNPIVEKEIKISITTEKGTEAKTEGDLPKGIKINLNSNQGTRGKGN